MNAYVGRFRNVHRLSQLLKMRIFSNTFGPIKKIRLRKLIKHRELGRKLPPKKSNTKTRREGAVSMI